MEYAIEHGADLFVWDADGMGLSLKRQVANTLRGEDCDWIPFRGNDSVEEPNAPFEDDKKELTDRKKQRTNKQALKNLRAQKYWDLRNRVYTTYLALKDSAYKKLDSDYMISFSSDIINP